MDDAAHLLLLVLERFRVVADLVPASVDKLLEHLLFFAEQEFEPQALALGDDFNVEILIDFVVLLVDELLEVISLVIELELPADGVKQPVQVVDDLDENSHDDQVEE